MKNTNLYLKILESSITLKGDVLILSGAQLMISYNLSGRIQDRERTQHPGACGALTYLQGVTQGERVPAECLSRSVIMYKSKYIHRGTLSQTVPGCVTRHTCHASVTHFRPISGNIVEVTLVTSPNLYINSHTKGTGFH